MITTTGELDLLTIVGVSPLVAYLALIAFLIFRMIFSKPHSRPLNRSIASLIRSRKHG